MISSVVGTIEVLGQDHVVVDVGPISLAVYCPTSTLSVLGSLGERVKLYTHLHLREEVVVLYGFATVEERSLFETIIEAAGIGPRLGLAMLSAMSAQRLASAIASGDVDQLTQINGMGKKTAARLVLELKGKIEKEWEIIAGAPVSQDQEEVVAALTALGYAASEARAAMSRVHLDQGVPLEEKVRAVLQSIGARQRE